MDYEIVTLETKKIAGLTARTGNHDPECGRIIGGLWQSFIEDELAERMDELTSPYTIGLYSDYGTDDYDVTVGMAVSDACADRLLSGGMAVKTIPAGKYAKFSLTGNVVTAVQNAWAQIWQLPLDRSYAADFEEYLDQHEDGSASINIYVALR